MRMALATFSILLFGQAADAAYLLEVRELTAENPPFSRNVYVCKPECTLEQFEAVTPPQGFEKAPAKLFLPTEVTANLPTAPPGVAQSLDLIPEVPGDDFVFVAQLVSAIVVGNDPTFGIFAVASIARDTRYRFAAGEVVHIVTDTQGDRYVLQAIAVSLLDQYDPAVVGGLAGTPLPDGWTYSSELLSTDLVAESGGLATVFAQGQYATWQRLPRHSVCTPAPADCRNPLQANKSRLLLLDDADDRADRLSWSWRAGPVSPRDDFGDPTATDGYRLCLYEDGALLGSFPIPQSRYWTSRNDGFAYDNPGGSTGGITSLRLKEGLVDGKARIGMKGSGESLALPDLSQISGVVEVQLRNDDDFCWGAVFSPPFLKQRAGRLAAISDEPLP